MVRFSKQDALNESERMKLISACKKDKERLVVVGLIYTGMRAGEFAHMKESWIDWQREVIHVPREEICDGKCCKGKWRPKNKSAVRQIPLTFEVKQLLYNWFGESKGINMTRVTLFNIVKRVGDRLRPFKRVYPHSLRATFASMMADEGLSVSDIQSIMGWSKIETANSYVRGTQALQNFREKIK